ncbi:T9SS type A sorting domain-containing protein [Luteirhabdus pelagi]|uniref:T9SS type A sorting domain-containing protein n=1 Tax=Luteirhabdus pelagi TaxID=2792783 RepID=UPI001939D9DF|nr:T9SS type A sorting domain-containing protein [Luteirhabdus pelagi]
MKKTLVLLIAIGLFCPRLFGQDPTLLENEWYLEKIIMASEEYERPYSDFEALFNASSETLVVFHPYCEEGFESLIEYEGEDIFTIDDGGVALIGICGDPDVNAFMQLHYQVYLEGEIAKNPFSYTIEDDGSHKTLTVSNADGDLAIYGDQLLNSEAFTALPLQLYPNPTTDFSFVKAQSGLLNYQLFDLNGRLVAEQQLSGTETRLDLSELPAALYFLRVQSEKATHTYKVVKQ